MSYYSLQIRLKFFHFSHFFYFFNKNQRKVGYCRVRRVGSNSTDCFFRVRKIIYAIDLLFGQIEFIGFKVGWVGLESNFYFLNMLNLLNSKVC